MIKLFIGSIFISNIVLTKFLGIDFKDATKVLYTSLVSAFICIVSGIVNYIIYYNLLVVLKADYLKTIIFILSITTISNIVILLIKKYLTNIYSKIEDSIPVILTNSLIIGISLLIINNGYNLIDTIVYSIGSSIGYILIMLLCYYLDSELSKRKVLGSFKGYPILLVTLGIICMIISRI